MKISAVIPVKNRKIFLKKAIDSVLDQNYPDIEVIVQDGLSDDGTVEMLRQYDSRVDVVSEKDSSAEEALVKGLQRATGDIILPLMSDDTMLPGSLEWAVEQFRKFPEAGAIYGDINKCSPDGTILSHEYSKPFDLLSYLNRESVPPFAATFIRSDAFKECNIEEMKKDLFCGEFKVWIELALKFPVLYVPATVANFTVHKDANTSKPELYFLFKKEYLRIIDDLMKRDDVPGYIKQNEKNIKAGICTWCGEGLLHLNRYLDAAEMLSEAIDIGCYNQFLMTNLVTKIYYTGLRLARTPGRKDDALVCLHLAAKAGILQLYMHYERAMVYAEDGDYDNMMSAVYDELRTYPQHEQSRKLYLDHLKNIEKKPELIRKNFRAGG